MTQYMRPELVEALHQAHLDGCHGTDASGYWRLEMECPDCIARWNAMTMPGIHYSRTVRDLERLGVTVELTNTTSSDYAYTDWPATELSLNGEVVGAVCEHSPGKYQVNGNGTRTRLLWDSHGSALADLAWSEAVAAGLVSPVVLDLTK